MVHILQGGRMSIAPTPTCKSLSKFERSFHSLKHLRKLKASLISLPQTIISGRQELATLCLESTHLPQGLL